VGEKGGVYACWIPTLAHFGSPFRGVMERFTVDVLHNDPSFQVPLK
jgi:hypothetical protein